MHRLASSTSLVIRFVKPVLAPVLVIAVGLTAPAFGCGPERLERAVIARTEPAGDLHLADGRVVRLAGLDRVRGEWLPLRSGDPVAIGVLEQPDRWNREPAIVFALTADADPVFLQEWLARTGRVLIRHEPALGSCWDVLRRAEAAATVLPSGPEEPGRYARVEGRVVRVGEGRTARFVTIRTGDGGTATGMVAARNIARMKRDGVDVGALTGHIVRLRGVRSLRNPRIIAVTRAEQIEIVR